MTVPFEAELTADNGSKYKANGFLDWSLCTSSGPMIRGYYENSGRWAVWNNTQNSWVVDTIGLKWFINIPSSEFSITSKTFFRSFEHNGLMFRASIHVVKTSTGWRAIWAKPVSDATTHVHQRTIEVGDVLEGYQIEIRIHKDLYAPQSCYSWGGVNDKFTYPAFKYMIRRTGDLYARSFVGGVKRVNGDNSSTGGLNNTGWEESTQTATSEELKGNNPQMTRNWAYVSVFDIKDLTRQVDIIDVYSAINNLYKQNNINVIPPNPSDPSESTDSTNYIKW